MRFTLARRIGFIVLTFVAAVVVQIPINSVRERLFGKSYRIPSPSMSPALLAGDYIFTTPMRRQPRIGDVIVFRSPADSTTEFVKRVVGIPGDTIGMLQGRLVRNGRPVDEAYAHHDGPDMDPTFARFRHRYSMVSDWSPRAESRLRR